MNCALLFEFASESRVEHHAFTFMKKLTLLLSLLLGAALCATAADGKKLLVVTVTKGFRHSSIGTAEKVLGKLANDQKNGFSVDYVRNDEDMASKMTPDALK